MAEFATQVIGLVFRAPVSLIHLIYWTMWHLYGQIPKWWCEYRSSWSSSRAFQFQILPCLLRLGILGPYSQSLIDATRHHWLEENHDVLRNIDVKEALCNPDSPLRANLPRMPDDLFSHIHIGYSIPYYYPAWHNTERVLTDLLSCTPALQGCKQLYINIRRHDGKDVGGLEEPALPPAALPHLLVQVLLRMPQLQELSWIGPNKNEAALQMFGSALESGGSCCPSITHLELSKDAQFFAKVTPNLESLTTSFLAGAPIEWLLPRHKAQYSLLEVARTREKLKTFGMHADWTPRLAKRAVEALPQIETLYLDGTLSKFPRDSARGQSAIERVKGVLDVLRGFQYLTSLRLPGPGDLGLRDPDGICGHAYVGPEGHKKLRMDVRIDLTDVEFVGRTVLDVLPHLSDLTIGYAEFSVQGVHRDGRFIWPWTGRLRDYLLEHYPWEADEDPEGPLFPKGEGNEEAILDENWSEGDLILVEDFIDMADMEEMEEMGLHELVTNAEHSE